MEVIILSLNPYKEKDFIVNALSVDGFVSFKASGAQSINSKFASKLFVFSLANIELATTKVGYTLTYIQSISSTYRFITNYEKLVTLNLIGEIITRTLKDETVSGEMFSFLKTTILALEHTDNYYSLILLFIAHYLQKTGYGLIINRCANCGIKTNIVGLSLSSGGLVCLNHAQNAILLSGEEIKIIRYAFMYKEEEMRRHEFTNDEVSRLVNILLTHFEETFNISLLSKEIFKTI